MTGDIRYVSPITQTICTVCRAKANSSLLGYMLLSAYIFSVWELDWEFEVSGLCFSPKLSAVGLYNIYLELVYIWSSPDLASV